MNDATIDMKSRIEDAEAAEAERDIAPDQAVVAAVPGGEEVVNFDNDGTLPQKSLGDHVSEAADKAVSFAKEHPLATVAGGVVLGVLVASMFKGPRRAAAAGGAKAAGLAALGGELAMAFATQMIDAAGEAGREGARKLDDLGDSLGDTSRSLRRNASFRADKSIDAARIARREAAKKLSRAFKRD